LSDSYLVAASSCFKEVVTSWVVKKFYYPIFDFYNIIYAVASMSVKRETSVAKTIALDVGE
jgi:hypothetical protein